LEVYAQGVGDLLFSGVAGNVSLDLAGIQNLYLLTGPEAAIRGKSSGISTVFYSAGKRKWNETKKNKNCRLNIIKIVVYIWFFFWGGCLNHRRRRCRPPPTAATVLFHVLYDHSPL
jgi:hypothetical protein